MLAGGANLITGCGARQVRQDIKHQLYQEALPPSADAKSWYGQAVPAATGIRKLSLSLWRRRITAEGQSGRLKRDESKWWNAVEHHDMERLGMEPHVVERHRARRCQTTSTKSFSRSEEMAQTIWDFLANSGSDSWRRVRLSLLPLRGLPLVLEQKEEER